ncbi:MAG TPA: tRNA (adenosine(37)-N6)-dimethylallyltransferase MiaA [Candidatus Limnocylindrales bacterium]|nr:tRNA (adenosine(37)-N6)-dimethylallyltransferase MiaA [Candidatus Limnocylindrales bacterium]
MSVGARAGQPTAAPPLLVVAGATATGKTGLAIALAERLVGEGIVAEVISADSRQVFRGLDIGTAKATLDERRGISHHGLDLVEPDQPFSLADFVAHADSALAGIADRGGLAILAGGTGLYLRAIARGIPTDALPSDADVRARLEAEFLAVGLDPLVERLRAVAPERAATIDTRNPRRVVRALEIAALDGGRGRLPEPRGYNGPVAWIGLSVDRSTHLKWIATRARAQFDAGLVEEARALRERFSPELPAFSAIGYREAWAVLDGRLDREQAITEDARRNAAFAKRQRTWFRAEPDITWLDADGSPGELALVAARGLLDATRPAGR